jgi:hypothetical protein
MACLIADQRSIAPWMRMATASVYATTVTIQTRTITRAMKNGAMELITIAMSDWMNQFPWVKRVR